MTAGRPEKKEPASVSELLQHQLRSARAELQVLRVAVAVLAVVTAYVSGRGLG